MLGLPLAIAYIDAEHAEFADNFANSVEFAPLFKDRNGAISALSQVVWGEFDGSWLLRSVE